MGYEEHVDEAVQAAMLQEVFEHFDRLAALEAGATARTSTPVGSQPEEIPTPNEEPAAITTGDGWGCETECDSEDEAALLECAMMDCEAELHMSGRGQGPLFPDARDL